MTALATWPAASLSFAVTTDASDLSVLWGISHMAGAVIASPRIPKSRRRTDAPQSSCCILP